MPIKTLTELQNAYRAARQVIEEHPDHEAMQRRWEELQGELMERSRVVRLRGQREVVEIEL